MTTVESCYSLTRFCSWLKKLSQPATVEEMRKRLMFRITVEEWADHIRDHINFKGKPYGRAELKLPDHPFPFNEVLLLSWPAGVRSKVHDHGGAICGVRVLQGTAREVVYELRDGGKVRPVSSSLYLVGHITCRNETDIHSVEAVDGNMLSLHVYPRGMAMKTYEVADES